MKQPTWKILIVSNTFFFQIKLHKFYLNYFTACLIFSNIMDKNLENWEERKNFYRKVFSSIDEDLNGYLSDKEFKKFLMTCDIQVIATLTISNFYAFSKKVFLQTYLKLRRKYSRKII